ncbi:RNA-binding cell elongation regulator Jag/EloR [Enterococcus dispar]|uniref:RNA-binding protein KhpB n=1 Tax=Enterococcus dispar ATCC 51266 TaxID=1139219 RepID=S1P023_9ENTE|nr:RNA-binding cell elongation regulator Jag/EloR [Enterococcus dispar]EOT39804.1 RNA-binding protein [Enterococcus dispar ATCC 51266]EOW86429.1 RNA-binding protein [Enterococcus dispar ATCC 51266]OJG38212.1 RNA-binding protein [Enterococcus dispar]WCG32095.1 protein jag [Enterococcus dispar]
MPIYKGATSEEAITTGLTALGISKDEAVIEVIEEAKKGFLGMGKKNARVSIEPSVTEEISEAVTETVEDVLVNEEQTPVVELDVSTATMAEEPAIGDVLSDLDDEAALTQLALYLTNITNELNAPALVKTERENGMVIFHLDTKKQGILIGKHGKMLNALQYLAQVFIHRVAKNKLSVVVNVGDYRQKRQAILQRLAERTAEKVKRTGRPVFLEPMPAFERKQIHSALSHDDSVKTHSEGDEPYRYLVVEPNKKYY